MKSYHANSADRHVARPELTGGRDVALGSPSAICYLSFVVCHLFMPFMYPPDSSGARDAREIKQIATLGSGEIVALCNDGTVWIYAGSSWQKLPDLPKEDRG